MSRKAQSKVTEHPSSSEVMRIARCQSKIQELWHVVEALEAKRALLQKHGLAIEQVAREITFQMTRVAWLQWCTSHDEEAIRARAVAVEEKQLGPDGLMVMRSGLAQGLPDQVIQWMAELAMLKYALGEQV